jgi:hypothetical protein
MNEIQNLRKELTEIIINQIKPKRDKLDKLLNKEAERLCPFSINDIITLENGKRGIITEINYYSLDYPFFVNKFTDTFDRYLEVDEIEYKYAYSVDNKTFSITWNISGLRLKNDGTPGKIKFIDINPINYNINKKSKSVKHKDLNDYMSNADISLFEDINL